MVPLGGYHRSVPEESSNITQFGLRDYLQIFRRRKWIILLTVLVVVAGSLALSLSQKKVYSATSEVLLLSENAGNEMDTQVSVVKSEAVREIAQKQLPAAGQVQAAPKGEKSSILVVSAESSDPEQAEAIVDTYVGAYIEFRRNQSVEAFLASARGAQTKIADLQREIDSLNNELRQGTTNIANRYRALPGDPGAANEQRILEERIIPRRNTFVEQQVLLEAKLRDIQVDQTLTTGEAKVVTPAVASTDPVRPNPQKDGLTALGAALLLGVLLAFLFEYLDDSIKGRDDVERALDSAVPVLGVVPTVPQWKKASNAELVSVGAPRSPAAEAYRYLRTSVSLLGGDSQVTSLQITSPGTQEGATTTVANLGVVMARAGRRVTMLDCDLRRPRLHRFFGMSNDVGVSSVMLGEVALDDAVQPVPGVERLSLLASGPIPPNPSELLSSGSFAEVLNRLVQDGSFVLVDSPPLLSVTDASVLAALVDANLVVVAAGRTTRKQLHRAYELIRQLVDKPVAGVVLNRVPADELRVYETEGTVHDVGRAEGWETAVSRPTLAPLAGTGQGGQRSGTGQ